MVCERCFISGRVQGVFYRASAQIKAHDLGITGYARNLSDGRVEMLVCGEEQKVTEFKGWMWQGPVHAKVESVVCEITDDKCPANFITG